MDNIHKLPFLFGGFMAVIAGAINYSNGFDSQTIYINMTIFMVIFYILGIYIKNTIVAMNKEQKVKRENELNLLNQNNAENPDKNNTNENGGFDVSK